MKIKNNRFSIFPCGWWDEAEQKAKPRQHPQQTQDIRWAYEYITSGRARRATEELRAIMGTATREQKQQFKALNFEYATFSGIFYYRNARSIIARSPFLTIDIDGLTTMEEARALQNRLCEDTNVTTALAFVSPSGLGTKWVVELPEWVKGAPFREQFEQVRRYVGFTYGYDPDKSGSDVCRACYLPWDEKCYINKKYLCK